MKLLCEIYKSPRKAEMYLYVDKSSGLEELPATLLQQFGEPDLVMTLLLTPTKKLARVDVNDVIEGITEQGYFLQMPPAPYPKARLGASSD